MHSQAPVAFSPADAAKINEKNGKVRPARQLTYIAAARLLPSFCILASHLSFERVFRDPVAQSVYYRIFNPAGFNAVSFFIVLSGFILTWVSADRPPARDFQPKRLLRILPVHFLSWAIIVCAFSASFTPAGLFATLTLSQGWFPNHNIYWAANAPAWTLTTELVLYAVFPAVYRFLIRKTNRYLYTVLVALVAIVVLLPAVLSAFPNGTTFANAAFTERGHLVSVSEWKYWLVYVFPLTRVLEALCGMVVCLLVLRGKWPKTVLLPAALLVLAIVVEQLWAPILFTLSALTIVPILLLIGTLATKEVRAWKTGASKKPRGRPGQAVARLAPYGKYTFGIYMYQWLFILICEKYLQPWNNATAVGILVIITVYATCVATSIFSYRFFESPVNNFIKPAIAARTNR